MMFFPQSMYEPITKSDLAMCDDLGHLPCFDDLYTCIDCGVAIDENRMEVKGGKVKAKSDKKATVTKGASTVKPYVPPEPRVYKDFLEFKDFLPGAPDIEVLPPV